jgi:hypothetical protein
LKKSKPFLDRIVWMFHQGGVLTYPSHTSYILEWLKTSHFVSVGGAFGKCIGGSSDYVDELGTAFGHLRTWTALARDVLRAEFPEFDLVSAFSVFRLPKRRLTQALALSPDTGVKLDRLARAFKKPGLRAQYEDHYSYACAAAERSGFEIEHEAAWVDGVAARHNNSKRIACPLTERQNKSEHLNMNLNW